MNVLVRNSRINSKSARRRRQVPGTADLQPRSSDTAEHQLPAFVGAGSSERHRLHGPVEDNALYSCHCGYVFEALVSTSVGCPHCGTGQAW
jgi:hypothetical protein